MDIDRAIVKYTAKNTQLINGDKIINILSILLEILFPISELNLPSMTFIRAFRILLSINVYSNKVIRTFSDKYLGVRT